ncbi:MAG: hypothetical protein ACK5UQ_09495 [Planctomycetota bacterium]
MAAQPDPQRRSATGAARRLAHVALVAAAAAAAPSLAAQQPAGAPPAPGATPPVGQQPAPPPAGTSPPAPTNPPSTTHQGPPSTNPAAANPPTTTPAPAAPPLDPTNAAAEILRRRLGLKPGPEGQVPAGPATPPPAPAAPATGANAAPATPNPPSGPAPRTPTTPTAPAAQEPQGQPSTSPPAVPPTPPDPTDQAAEALRRLLPRSKPPERAPIPGQDPAVPPPPEPVPTAAVPAASDALPVQGSLWLRYRARHGGGATDHDVVGRLGVDIGRADRDAVTAHLRARGFWNADGFRRDDPFPGLDHSFGDEWNGRLYAAHVDVHRQGPIELARLGRQDLDETPTTLQFDGARVDSVRFGGRSNAFFGGYGGIPVHQFEASRDGDLVVGVHGGLVPWLGARMRFDAMHLRDEFLAIDREDDLLSARWWQSLEGVQLHGFHSWRDGQPRDLHVGARGELLGCDWSVDWRELLTTQRQQVTELDPFSLIAFEYAPFRQLDATLRREIVRDVEVGAGVDLRRLQDGGDQSAFNREFERLHADMTWRDVRWRGLSLSLAGSYWNSSGEDFRTVTGEVAYRPDAELRIAVGSGYDLFLYDVFDARERLHVRSYYLRLDRRLAASLRVDAGYELQRDDVDEFHLFRLGMTWTF